MTDKFFTFGQAHVCDHPGLRGRLADHWVRVTASDGMHRAVFMDQFTKLYCPARNQFAFEYDEEAFKREFYPAGELCHINGGHDGR